MSGSNSPPLSFACSITSRISACTAEGYRNGSPRIAARQAFDDVVVGAGLEHVARGARPQRLEQELLVVVHREDQDVAAPAGAAAARAAAWRPVLRGMLMSRIARSTSGSSARSTAPRPVDRLGDDLEVRLGG